MWVERGLLGMGSLLVAFCLVGLIDRAVSSAAALREFDQAQAADSKDIPAAELTPVHEQDVDFRLWSEQRLRAYRQGSATDYRPLAVLRIDKIHLKAPVFGSTDALALNRGVGWIAGTARPGEGGNIGIAGHRDGFFRGLKDVSLGDTIELSTVRETAVYVVDRIEIVSPRNTSVLAPHMAPTLTLVTCYPFYLVGDAPKRYVLHASLRERVLETVTQNNKGEKYQ